MKRVADRPDLPLRQVRRNDGELEPVQQHDHAVHRAEQQVPESGAELRVASIRNGLTGVGHRPGRIPGHDRHVALNTLTNYVNEVAETTIDFRAVKAREAA
jgi:hypothetical protein